MSDAIGAHMPEPRPERREPASFTREIEPMPGTRRRGGSKGTFNKGHVACGYCKRRDGSHTAKCPRKSGRHSRAAKLARPTGSGGAIARPIRFLSGSPVIDRARDLVRQRVDEEIEATEAYLTELRRVRAEV